MCWVAAELLEHFQWVSTESVKDNERWTRAVGEEMADVVFLIMEMADSLGVDVAEAFEKKLVKQAEKYPLSEFNPGMSQEEQIQSYYKVKAKTRTDHPFGKE